MKYDIGFLGGGQLARMSIQAAQRMGLKCLSLDTAPDTPAAQVATALVGRLDDQRDVEAIVRSCERVTLENEFLHHFLLTSAAKAVGRDDRVYTPSPRALFNINDKLRQRRCYQASGVPSPRAVGLGEGWLEGLPLEDVAREIEYPMVIKSCFGGYDGKGTRTARNRDELESYRSLWEQGGWLAEEFVAFKRELAVMVCRSESQTVCFPTMETVQTDHVCDLVFPAQTDASEIAVQAVEAIEGYGLFGVELFELPSGRFQVNEIAPRPHNTGHYSLDWGGLSQFEAHVRLVMGLPLPEPRGHEACMANLLGIERAGDFREGIRAAVREDPGVHVHWYGKSESRPGRKMGHINAVGEGCVARARAARERFYGAWRSA